MALPMKEECAWSRLEDLSSPWLCIFVSALGMIYEQARAHDFLSLLCTGIQLPVAVCPSALAPPPSYIVNAPRPTSPLHPRLQTDKSTPTTSLPIDNSIFMSSVLLPTGLSSSRPPFPQVGGTTASAPRHKPQGLPIARHDSHPPNGMIYALHMRIQD
jgi:hypothetical protein